MYTIIESMAARHIPQLLELYRQCPWAKDRTLEDAESIVRNTTITLGIVDDNGNLIGFSRVLSDLRIKALILDVVVDESHRGEGLGKLLLDTIVKHPKLANVKHFELYCREKMIPFYERFGFTEDLGDFHFMRRVIT